MLCSKQGFFLPGRQHERRNHPKMSLVYYNVQNFYIPGLSSAFRVGIVDSEDIPKVERVSPNELKERTIRIQSFMEKSSLDGAMIMTPANRYYIGGMVQDGAVYVPSSGEPVYLVRRGYDRVRAESPLENIVRYGRFSDIPDIIAGQGLPFPKTLGIETDSVPVSMYQRLSRSLPGLELDDVSQVLLRARMVKSSYELRQIRKAAEMVDRAFRKVPSMLREGMSELELQAAVEYDMRLAGHPGAVRAHGWGREFTPGITLAGKSGVMGSYVDTVLGGVGLSPSMPAGPSFGRIGKDEPVILDFVGCWNGYFADMTRTFCIGELPSDVMAGYEWCKNIQAEIVAEIESGKPLVEVTSFAFSRARDDGYGEQFMGLGDGKVSFIGHGIGLELDEYPVIFGRWRDSTMPGQVIAIEPKLIFPGIGAVGVENTWYVKSAGNGVELECITNTPYSL